MTSKNTKRVLLGMVAAIAVAGCVPGAGELTAIGTGDFRDADGNGHYDGVDPDGDGLAEYGFSESAELDGLIRAAGWCADPHDVLIDVDGDGIADQLDLDCDGVPDVELFPDGSAGTGGQDAQACEATLATDAETLQVSCTGAGGALQCECRVDGVLVDTCTTSDASACSLPVGSCCNF